MCNDTTRFLFFPFFLFDLRSDRCIVRPNQSRHYNKLDYATETLQTSSWNDHGNQKRTCALTPRFYSYSFWLKWNADVSVTTRWRCLIAWACRFRLRVKGKNTWDKAIRKTRERIVCLSYVLWRQLRGNERHRRVRPQPQRQKVDRQGEANG